MEFHLLQILAFLFVAFVSSHATVDPEGYFKSMLPNTPIPKAIKDSLSIDLKGSSSYVMDEPDSIWRYNDAASHEELRVIKSAALYFLEKDMHPGKTIHMHITKDISARTKFIPRQAAESLSNMLQSNNEAFSVNPGSVEAKLMKKTIKTCEKFSQRGEEMYCAASLESMVDFVISKMGKNVKAISTEVNGIQSTTLQEYRVEGIKKIAKDNVIICHQLSSPYAVNYCHRRPNVFAYLVSLAGENNLRAKAISICHQDTSTWNPDHFSLQVLNAKPGTDNVCHFLVEGDLAWVPI